MGAFYMAIELGDEQGANWRPVDALVDTGASTTSVPASVLRELGVRPVSTERFRFAQGEVRELPVGYAWIRFARKELLTQVISMPKEPRHCWAGWRWRVPTWLLTRLGRG